MPHFENALVPHELLPCGRRHVAQPQPQRDVIGRKRHEQQHQCFHRKSYTRRAVAAQHQLRRDFAHEGYWMKRRVPFRLLTSAAPSRSRAAATTSASSPSRAAILSALERPGMPHSSRYVGRSATSSNSMLTFSKRSSSYLSDVSALQGEQGVVDFKTG